MSIVFTLHMFSDDIEHLPAALTLCIAHITMAQPSAVGRAPRCVTHWSEEKNENGSERLTLYRIHSGDMIPSGATRFPGPLNLEEAVAMAKAWLAGAERGPEPDLDGSVGKAYVVKKQDSHSSLVICVIEAAWAEYGK